MVEEKVAEKTDEKKIILKKSDLWKYSTFILIAVVLISAFFMLSGKSIITGRTTENTGDIIEKNDIGEKALDFFNTQLSQTPGTLESVEEESGLYIVSIMIDEQSVPLYFTKDGKWINQGYELYSITEDAVDNTNTQDTEVPKSDKPKVQAFIFSYCPYGLQFEKALFPVYDLLKDKADIDIVAIGAMHGEFEKIESLRQISIEQIYGKDKLFVYLAEFAANINIGSCNGDSTCLNNYLPALYTKLGIDKTKVENYMKASAEKIYDEQGAKASALGISGSPTFVINGVKISVSRTADEIKTAVCFAFNTAPSECSQTLSTTSPSAGFGAVSGTAASAAGSC